MTNNDDKPQSFFDAQVAFAKSKHGKEQKRKETQGSRYYQVMQAAKRSQAQNDDGKEDKR